MIKSLGSYLIIPKKDFPYFEKAHKIARELTEQRLDDILEHRYHLHANPKRKKVTG